MEILDRPLSELAREVPGATAIFHKHRLNFCCSGAQSLRQAAHSRQLDGDLVAAELQALVRTPTETDIAQAPDGLLIEHIVTRYHDVHRQQLPELIRLAARLERVHGGHPECPVGLTRHLEEMQRELAIHMDKEERILFPMIFRGMGAAALEPIAIMRREHDDHGESLAQLERVTHGMIEPPDACTTWRALYSGLRTLRTDLMDHIHLENNVLFHRFDA